MAAIRIVVFDDSLTPVDAELKSGSVVIAEKLSDVQVQPGDILISWDAEQRNGKFIRLRIYIDSETVDRPDIYTNSIDDAFAVVRAK